MELNKTNKNIYKLYQLMEFFTNKFGFSNIMVKNYIAKNEIWLSNTSNSAFNVIRISTSTLDETYIDSKRINNYLDTIKSSLRNEIKFIDIHVSNEEVSSLENYPTVCLEQDFYSGVDIEFAFPGIRYVVHNVDNAEEEIANKVTSINENLKNRIKQKRNLFMQKFNINATFIIEMICILNFLFCYYISTKYDNSTALIITGADYKFFTLELKQYWRIFTYAFCHSGFLHLFINMYSLHIIGTYAEKKYGTVKYLCILFTAIVIGSLTRNILTDTDNSLAVGMSGGIYALFTVFIIDAISKGAWQDRNFILMVGLNLALNFMSNIAWQTHLGGALVGFIFFYLYKDDKVDYRFIILLVLIFAVLFYKFLSIGYVYPIYAGTDYNVVEALRNLNLNKIADNLAKALYNNYIK